MGAIIDPVGNGLAIIALVGMLIVLGGSLYRLRGGYSLPITAVWWQMPVVALAGVGVAGYLVVMTVRPETAVCLPVADCRILQQSRYAYPFGVPVGVVALLGNLAILAVWSWGQFGSDAGRRWIPWILFGLTFVGELFAIIFTFLVSFVIGAACAWCLASGVLMTILFWQSVETIYAVRMWRLAG